jgi:hypothetical protein
MHIQKNNRRCLFVLWLFLAVFAFSSNNVYSHGTFVATIVTSEGIVMASDGLNVQETPTGHSQTSFQRSTSESGPKIAVCNVRFLCGTAGLEGIDWPDVHIKYHFLEWLPVPKAKTRPTVREYARLIQAKARVTFKDMDTALKKPEYWDPETSESETLERWAIAGYDGDTPKDCIVEVGLDTKTRQVAFPAITCRTVANGPVDMVSGPEWMDKTSVRGTPENRKFAQFSFKARAAIATLFPNSPPSVQNAITTLASMTAVCSYVEPHKYGGITWIGVLEKGNSKMPTITHHPELSAANLRK